MGTRKAIIIGNSGGYRGLHHLLGVEIDVKNYENYLTTKAGGQWYPNEIITLIDSDSATVFHEVQNAIAEYTFIVFCGHGFINTYDVNDYVCLKDMDVSISKLISPSKKQTLVIDACREYYTQLPEEIRKLFVNESAFSASEGIDTRGLFDEAISVMPTGILVVYSTQPGQSAGDDEFKGGHFTYSFIKSGRDWWHSSASRGIFRINDAIPAATKIMKSTFLTLQTPTMGGQVRRLTFPPFAFAKR